MWRAVADDPNSAPVLGYRQAQIDAARQPSPRRSRNQILLAEVAGRRVLDVGCAGHAARVGQEAWLHGQIAAVAGEAVGIDIDEAGIAAMNAAGFRGLVAGAEDAEKVLAEAGTFDVVVAADVIEHLPAPQSLLDLSAAVLRPNGRLVVTTPNPFAPWRVRAARRHQVRDNVDHVVLIFPSGMAEMAARTGLCLSSYTTVGFRTPYREARRLLGELRVHRHWRPVIRISDYLAALRYGAGSFGETSVYVLTRQ